MSQKKPSHRISKPILYLLLVGLLITAAAAAFYDPHGTADGAGRADMILPSTAEATPPKEKPTSVGREFSSGAENAHTEEGTVQRPETSVSEPISMEDTLFIGDSRTVGLLEYAGIEGATYFATIGMNVYKANTEEVSVPGVGKLTLPKLLARRQYTRICVMLGINELGYPLTSTVKKYGELIDSIQMAQPEALIFIQANLHVTKERSEKDEVINNPKIDALNERASE